MARMEIGETVREEEDEKREWKISGEGAASPEEKKKRGTAAEFEEESRWEEARGRRVEL